MFKAFVNFISFYFIAIAPLAFVEGGGCNSCFGDFCQSFEIGVGWRRDALNWDLDNLQSDSHSYYFSTLVDSKIEFEKIEMYTAYAKTKWVGEGYYIRLSAAYGRTEKGRAEELFRIDSSVLDGTLSVFTNDPIKRRSEVYDFIGAVGYPFMLLDYCLMATPLIGFSFHRQHLRTKHRHHCSHSFNVKSSNPYDFPDLSSSFSSDDYYLDSTSSPSNPFASRSNPSIPSAIGLNAEHHSSSYRFTWYGFSLGLDLAYALDHCWTLFTDFEWHFTDRCHRKRHSSTGVDFIDSYHRKGWATGFNGTVGAVWSLGSCWYATATVDYKYWWSYLHHDRLDWLSVGTNLALGYVF